MGKVSGNWLTGAHSGSACRHEDIYTKVNRKTGACYSVKLCSPNTEWTESQLSQRASFGAISSALSAWISTNKATGGANHADYVAVKAKFDRQTKYATLRGYMYAKGMYTVSGSTVTVNVNATTNGSSQNSGGATANRYTVTLTASPANGGSVGSDQSTVSAGDSVHISASANSGYTFTKWSDDNTSASRDITVNGNISLTAIFTATGSGEGDEEGGGEGGNDDDDSSYA